jgi:uncharacterized protein (TIGR00369 family)
MDNSQQFKLDQLSKTFTEIPFNRMLGLQLESITAEQAVMSFSMKQELIGNYLYGILHGGVISSVLDMAGGILVMSAAIYKHTDKSLEMLADILGKCSTVNLQINYLRPGRGEQFTAKSQLVKVGNKISFVQMELYNDAKLLIATGNGTYSHP